MGRWKKGARAKGQRGAKYLARWSDNKKKVEGDGPSIKETMQGAIMRHARQIYLDRQNKEGSQIEIHIERNRRWIKEVVTWHKIKTFRPDIFRFFHGDEHYFIQYFSDGTERRSVVYVGYLSAIAALRGGIIWEP